MGNHSRRCLNINRKLRVNGTQCSSKILFTHKYTWEAYKESYIDAWCIGAPVLQLSKTNASHVIFVSIINNIKDKDF
jgi:hypothetical protein